MTLRVPEAGEEPAARAAWLLRRAATVPGDVVWLLAADGDAGLTDALARELAAAAETGRPGPEVELVAGSWDLPGARLLDLVAVMDRLRSPGGCPWDAEQTHRSLLPYLLEEAYETVEAVETDDLDGAARGARRPAAAGGVPRPARRGAPRPPVVGRRRGRRHRRQAGARGTRTCSRRARARRRRRTRSTPAGTSSSGRRRGAVGASTASRSTSPRWPWRPSCWGGPSAAGVDVPVPAAAGVPARGVERARWARRCSRWWPRRARPAWTPEAALRATARSYAAAGAQRRGRRGPRAG